MRCCFARYHRDNARVATRQGFKQLSSDPVALRMSFRAEYDAVAQGTGLVDLVNSSRPELSSIIDNAIAAGVILEDVGPALHVGGQVPDISESDLNTQRLLATKAALELELQQHRLDSAKASFQTVQWQRQAADAISRKNATLKRARAICDAARCAWPDCPDLHVVTLLWPPWRSCVTRQALCRYVLVGDVSDSLLRSLTRRAEAGGASPFQTPSPKAPRRSSPPVASGPGLCCQIIGVVTSGCAMACWFCIQAVAGPLSAYYFTCIVRPRHASHYAACMSPDDRPREGVSPVKSTDEMDAESFAMARKEHAQTVNARLGIVQLAAICEGAVQHGGG